MELMAVQPCLGGQCVIVTEANLLDSNGVVLIDNGNSVICQQLLKGAPGIQVWPSVAQVIQSQQYLSACLQPVAQKLILRVTFSTALQYQLV